MAITEELLNRNGWTILSEPYKKAVYVYNDFGAEYLLQDNLHSLGIWYQYKEKMVADVFVGKCETSEKLSLAFKIAGIDYELKK